MNLRAVICDIYGTLLEVGPGPANAAELWRELCRRFEARGPSLEEFDARCQEAVRAAHAESRGRGVSVPEVCWARIAAAAWPELGGWEQERREAFLYEHAQLQKTVRLMPGAAEVLAALDRRGVLLGLCSNCQPYTLRELREALAGAGFPMERFHPRLRFLSFEAGFSKPDAGAFRHLEEALAALGIGPAEALLVGDRADNDILPAKARGWQTWQLAAAPTERPGGTWKELSRSPGKCLDSGDNCR